MKEKDQQATNENEESKPSILDLKRSKEKSNYFSGNAPMGTYGKANSKAMSSQKNHRIKRGSN